MIKVIGFDGDDTLWDNEQRFELTQEKFRRLLAPYNASESLIDERLLTTEQRNIELFGYGAKGFALSMIETAIELTEGRITGREIQVILNAAVGMLSEPVQPLSGVIETLEALKGSYKLLLVTKGDLFEQESKIVRSGLRDKFDAVEIVSNKDTATYTQILSKHAAQQQEFLMVGNSVRSDILPVLDIGASAVHIPYHITWKHELVHETVQRSYQYMTLSSIAELPSHLASLAEHAR